MPSLEKPAYYERKTYHTGTHVLYTRKDLHPSGQQSMGLVDIEGTEATGRVLNFGAGGEGGGKSVPDGRGRVPSSWRGNAYPPGRVGRLEQRRGSRWLIDDPNAMEMAFEPFGTDKAVVVENREVE